MQHLSEKIEFLCFSLHGSVETLVGCSCWLPQ